METVDHVRPGTRWDFNEEVTNVFENMLRRSIPQYEAMRASCFDLACRYVARGTDVVDLGCSRGDGLAPLLDRYAVGDRSGGARNHFIGIDLSKPMLEVCRARFHPYIRMGVVDIRELDLRTEYPACLASVTLAVLTLQFVPIEHRQRVIQRAYASTRPGGALILVEKILGNTAEVNETMVQLYYEMKTRNGYTVEEIERKRLSLEGVLVPVTAAWNEDMLRAAGFRQVDCFWRWMNFAGWLAVK